MKAPENLSDKRWNKCSKKEGERILSKIKDGDVVVAMAIEGDLVSSEQLTAKRWIPSRFAGRTQVILCHRRLSWVESGREKTCRPQDLIGRITLPHQLMRLVLTEQIYRAFRINAGHAYHKISNSS